MLTITVLFLLASLLATILSAIGKCPLWVGVVLLWVVVALATFPIR